MGKKAVGVKEAPRARQSAGSDAAIRVRREILKAWMVSARTCACAEGLGDGELAEEISVLLGSLGGAPTASSARHTAVERYAARRIRQGYSSHEMVDEVAMLGASIEANRHNIDRGELHDMRQDLQLALVEAISIFDEHMLEDAQLEKRARRDLASIFASRSSLRARLERAMERIRMALGVEMAVLLLPEDDALIACAVSGTCAAEMSALGTKVIDDTTFIGRATREDSAVEADLAAEGSALSELLTARGFMAAASMRFASVDRRPGVVYVATKSAGSFAGARMRMLEGLADALRVHVAEAYERAEHAHERDALRREVKRLTEMVDASEELPWVH